MSWKRLDLESKHLHNNRVEIDCNVEQYNQVRVDQNWHKPNKRDQCAVIQIDNEKRNHKPARIYHSNMTLVVNVLILPLTTLVKFNDYVSIRLSPIARG